MPQATLITTTVLACLVLAVGCGDRALDAPAPADRTIHRTTLGTSPATSEDVSPEPKSRPAITPEPAMSIPPEEESTDAPASEPPAAPTPPPTQYRRGCRPLVA
jgi:hypothetical protein